MLAFVSLYMIVSYAYGQVSEEIRALSPIVNTTQGWIQGIKANDGDYYAFYGIPYAGSTAGDNRFKPPTPAPIIEDIFLATDDSILCAQPGPTGPIGDEDCLTLSVFTNTWTTKKPVIVWLIGEEYKTSNPLRNSFRNLIENDIIVVALNYRLSVFGFLCLGIEEAPGNVGMKDVIEGLRWIQSNIEEFGGDASNVILFGHGSGAAMVDLITMSPLANNLVHKVIMHSGSALSPWAVSFDPIGSAESLSKFFYGFEDTKTAEELLELLKTINTRDLIDSISNFEFLNSAVLFAPCIENNETNIDGIFLHDAPVNLLEKGEFLHIPHVTGYTDREGTVRVEEAVNERWLEKMQLNFNDFLPVDLEIHEEDKSDVVTMIRGLYFAPNIISMNAIQEYIDYHGDVMIIIPLIRSAILKAMSSDEVRILEFGYRGTNNSDWVFDDVELTGAPHGGILNYVLDFDLRQSDRSVMASIVERYVNFANTGVPSAISGATWLPIRNLQFVDFVMYGGGEDYMPGIWHATQSMRQNPRPDHYSRWAGLYQLYQRVPAPVPVSAADRMTVSLSLVIVFAMYLVLNRVVN